MKKSIKLNAMLNIASTITGLLFPLLTLPYITRVLRPENYGRVIYANSIISYFILFAGLGIGNYALREGAAVRDNKSKFNDFANQIFTLNVISTICSYILLAVTMLLVRKLHAYMMLIAIMSMGIVFTTLGVSWVYKAYEEYTYITAVGWGMNIVTIIFIYVFVNNENDYYKYAIIWTLTYILPGILNFIRLRKYIKLRFIFTKKILVHLKPVLILFASSIATTIYLSTDTTILGFISGDYYTGLYAVSSRIYGVAKNILIAALTVSIPRFSYYFNNNMIKQYEDLLKKIQNIMFMLMIPMLTGLIILNHEIVLLIFGEEYIGAETSLKILSSALLFCMIGWICSQCILIPTRQEKRILKATLIGGGINIVLNIILIPNFQHNAAAFTTLLSEMAVSIIYVYYTKKYWTTHKFGRNLLQSIGAAVIMTIVVLFVKKTIEVLLVKVCVCVVAGAATYFFVLLLQRNDVMVQIVTGFINKKKLR